MLHYNVVNAQGLVVPNDCVNLKLLEDFTDGLAKAARVSSPNDEIDLT
jgi:hypothetical protein